MSTLSTQTNDRPGTHTEPEEISHLGSSVDLCLPSVLSLSQHGSRHQIVPVLSSDQIRSLQEDGSLIGPRDLLPSLLSLDAALDGLVQDLWGGRVGVGEDLSVLVGSHLGESVSGSDLLTVDDTGNVEGELGLHTGDSLLELFAVGRTGIVGPLEKGIAVRFRPPMFLS
jgi:hypothetical protein